MNKVICGDCLEVMRGMEDNSVDAIVTDPPYGLKFMGKKWDYAVPSADVWAECLRVLKHGGHLLCFGGTRTYHRVVCNIEDGGFEIRDTVAWVYGCLSEDTEILTINGWERYSKDIDQKSVLCYDINSGVFCFDKPVRSFIYENKYSAYHIKSDYTDQIVSRNHRVIVEREGKFVFQRAETLEQQENIPFLESLRDLPETVYDVQSHSSVAKQGLLKRVSEQCQSGKTFGENKVIGVVSEIKNKLRRLWEGCCSTKLLAEKDKTTNLFETLQRRFKGSGIVKILRSWKSGMDRKESGELSSKNVWIKKSRLEGRNNPFQNAWELCWSKIHEVSQRLFVYGTERRLCYGTPPNSSAILGQGLTEKGSGASHQSRPDGQQNREPKIIRDQSGAQKIRRTRAEVSQVEYDGKVWCVEVSTGAFVARRNGQIFITGNSGFPKSLNVGMFVDKLLGNERETIENCGKPSGLHRGKIADYSPKNPDDFTPKLTVGFSEWEGWGTALKPAFEPICLARKPLSEKNVALNCLKWGTGGLNIDGCKIPFVSDADRKESTDKNQHADFGTKPMTNNNVYGDYSMIQPKNYQPAGRFPSNFIHDGSDEVVELFPVTGGGSGKPRVESVGDSTISKTGGFGIAGGRPIGFETPQYGDSGSAARFFYCAKASKKDRDEGCEGMEEVAGGSMCANIGDVMGLGGASIKGEHKPREKSRNNHPTVKPTTLMRYLCRLITPPNGIILDPFMGSGSTGKAAALDGFRFIGIELDPHYYQIATARILWAENQKSAMPQQTTLFDVEV